MPMRQRLQQHEPNSSPGPSGTGHTKRTRYPLGIKTLAELPGNRIGQQGLLRIGKALRLLLLLPLRWRLTNGVLRNDLDPQIMAERPGKRIAKAALARLGTELKVLRAQRETQTIILPLKKRAVSGHLHRQAAEVQASDQQLPIRGRAQGWIGWQGIGLRLGLGLGRPLPLGISWRMRGRRWQRRGSMPGRLGPSLIWSGDLGC